MPKFEPVTRPVKVLTVAIYFSIEFEVEAEGEPEAMLKAAPNVQELEKYLSSKGYEFQLELARVRRPRSAEKALVREAARRE